jgi:hypothetical protein
MDIKLKICYIRTWEKNIFSQHILHQHWYTCPIALPVRRKPQHRSLLTVISATSDLRFNRFVLERISPLSCEPLYATNTSFMNSLLKHFFMNIIYIESFCPQKRRTTKHCSPIIYSSSKVTILTTETSLWICACASATCHEAGLFCYLAIYIDDLLRPLQLCYLHFSDLFTECP